MPQDATLEDVAPWRELARLGVTARELDVLTAVGERLSNAEMADRLNVSERTVESHVSSLLRKLEVSGRRQLASFAPAGLGSSGGASSVGDGLVLPLARMVERGGLFGRERELQLLVQEWEAAASETRVVLIRGEPGIGKSRLAAELAKDVHGRGGRILLGACVEGPQRPYEPFVAALESIAGLRDARLDALFPRPGVATDSDAESVVAADRDRLAVQFALYDLLAEAAEPPGLLFVLEDLHWASQGTREAVASIARSPRRAPLLMVVTSRDDPSTSGGYGSYLGRLARAPSVATVVLGGLDAAAAARLIGELGTGLEPAVGLAQTGGNPLFLRELARGGPGGQSLREVVAERFERLRADDVDVADAAVVTGDPIDSGLLAVALDRSSDDVLDALERIEGVGIIGAGVRAGTFAFTHDVFRSGRYADLGAARRMQLHAAIARALDGSDGADARLADVARHACLAGPRFGSERAADLARRAGDVAARATDYGAAVEHYRHALDAMALQPAPDRSTRLAVTIDLGAALILTGDAAGYEVLRAAVGDARRLDDDVLLATALCAMAPVPGGGPGGPLFLERFEELLLQTADALPPSETSWRIRLLAMLGVHLRFGDDVPRGTALITDALAAARQLGDPITLGRALMSFRFCGGPLDLDQKLDCGRELLDLGERTGQEIFTTVGCQHLSWCYCELGDRAAMNQWHDAAALRVRWPDLEQLNQVSQIQMLDGDLDGASNTVDDMERVEGSIKPYVEPKRFVIADLRGHLPDADQLRAALESDPHDAWQLEALLARSLARTGRLREAEALLEAARSRAYEPRYAPLPWTLAISCLAEAAALCGHVECAADIVGLFEPLAGRWVDAGIAVWDTVDRVRALSLLTAGEAPAARDLAERAVAASRSQHTPILLARELVVLAAATERLGGDGSASVREALAFADRTGARLVNHDARLLLTSPGRDDEIGLTPREEQVIERIATGETNHQVATALGISEATVRKHLEHAFQKLDVSTRTGAVARAAELRAMRHRT